MYNSTPIATTSASSVAAGRSDGTPERSPGCSPRDRRPNCGPENPCEPKGGPPGRAATTPPAVDAGLRLLWLEVTEGCQLECGHCYADSGPGGTHGVMSTQDWLRVIEQAAAVGCGWCSSSAGSRRCIPICRG